MSRVPTRILRRLGVAATLAVTASLYADSALAGNREEARVLTATQVLEEMQQMPDQFAPDWLLERAYGIAVIPNVIKVGFALAGRYGQGLLVVRDQSGRWSNPVFVALTGGSFGWQVGVQSTDIILVFTTRAGIDGISEGKVTLGADASVAAGPVGRQASGATDANFRAEVYSYSRTQGLFAGIALDGSALTMEHKANAAYYQKPGVTVNDIFASTAPSPPESGQRFIAALPHATGTNPAVKDAGTPPAGTEQTPATSTLKTYPMEDTKPGKEPGT
jgi:lipid-binding SYLF domain-containing protein